MAQPATNPKIEELRFKVKTDPKSRLFYPLAEELRKVGQFSEAEHVLRTGLTTHGSYLSAWVSLGRVLRDQKKDADAVEALTKALQIDPGNVVAARLLAEAYLTLGEKVEAIKKYKLVLALMPGDEEIEAAVARLEQELSGAPVSSPAPVPVPAPSPTPAEPAGAPRPPMPEGDVFDVTYSKLREAAQSDTATGDAEPMSAAHADSPFEETSPSASYGSDTFAVEQPPGLHLASAPLEAEVAAPIPAEPIPAETAPAQPQQPVDEADVFAPADSEVAPGFIQGPFDANVPPPPPAAEDFARTLTMADLYANQGLIDEARDIYEDILARDPNNEIVRAKVDALGSGVAEPSPAALPHPLPQAGEGTPEQNPKVARLEDWLSRMKRV